MEYLQCVSTDPKKRLSLRMTIFLIRGTILLFNKQVCLFQDELAAFFTKIRVPSLITRDVIPSQRDFETPPTPVIKGKRKRKPVKAAEGSMALEEFLRLGQEQDVNIELEPLIDIDDRRRRLQLVEEQPLLKLGVSDDILGDFGVVPMVPPPVREPEKVPSEGGSEKTMLEKIEELLAAEEEQDQLKPTRLKRKKRSSSTDASPKIIQVEAMVHRAVEEEEKGTAVEPTVIEKIEDKMESEMMEEKTFGPEVKRTEITEERKTMEQIQIVEQSVEKESTRLPEKPISTKKAVIRRVTDEDIEKTSQKSEEERKKKKQLVDKYLLIKFKKQKRVLHLDDYDKNYEFKEEFKIDIYNERFLDANLRNKVISKFTKIDLIEPVEVARGVRREGISSSQHSDELRLNPKLSPFSTPLDTKALSTPQLITDSSKLFATIEPVQSTPFREDVSMAQKILYDESRVIMEDVVQEKHEKIKDKFAPEFLVEEMLLELEKKPTTLTKIKDVESCTITESFISSKTSEEQKIRMKIIINKIEQWDKSHGDLTFDDLIPTPKNKRNAALAFGDLLALSKDGYVTLFPEENSSILKNVEKGKLLQ
ncbi:hypothetical protein WA026_008012 [Henosepilachna vigintioctopunctata]